MVTVPSVPALLVPHYSPDARVLQVLGNCAMRLLVK